ncbi:hypothetical protein HFP15_39540 [Amycolatopsis sp. K13G38]|uniref:Uncharacterized protein n=1 Tax=Amycolatopsis acididurans TaxID=2724524 RepID=A0ABX1JJA9_9PSEU|nr:hypothetical protein [Amycolatopsis acididurans]NKQ58955.1 hypothetical protein [Amycolatopsis acididurans]
MVEHEVDTVVEVARTADQCATAVRGTAYGRLEAVLRESSHHEELLALWVRLLVTVTPEDLAAEMVDELWRRDMSEWLVAIEHFLDYAHERRTRSLEAFVAEVVSWPWALQVPFARIMLTTIAKSLPEDILPSHYLVARGMLIEAAEEAGCPGLISALTGLVAQGWRQRDRPAMRLAFDLTRQVHRELPDRRTRHQAIAAFALVLGQGRAQEPVTVTTHGGARTLSEHDDPTTAPGAERATVVAARVVRHAASGALERIDAELADQAPGEQELVSVLLALTLAAATRLRNDAHTCLP